MKTTQVICPSVGQMSKIKVTDKPNLSERLLIWYTADNSWVVQWLSVNLFVSLGRAPEFNSTMGANQFPDTFLINMG